MGKFDRLMGKPMAVSVAGEDLVLHPLDLSNLDLLAELGKGEHELNGPAMTKLIVETMKKSYPDESSDDVLKISVEYLNELVQAILKVNNLKSAEVKK